MMICKRREIRPAKIWNLQVPNNQLQCNVNKQPSTLPIWDIFHNYGNSSVDYEGSAKNFKLIPLIFRRTTRLSQ